jgi:hypothetical protein
MPTIPGLSAGAEKPGKSDTKRLIYIKILYYIIAR